MNQTEGPAAYSVQTQPVTAATVPGPPQPTGTTSRPNALVWVIAAAFVAVELAVSGRYGFMQDELYFVEAGRHLALGYVDQPPLAPLLTRAMDMLSVSPVTIRVLPALAGGATVLIGARLAALFGAGRFGQALAALVTACTPFLLGADHVDNTTSFSLLTWAAVTLCVSTAVLRGRPRWWLGAGLAAGIGLEDDNLMLLLLVAILIGILATGHRTVLRTRWPWLGAGIAAVIWAPNVAWLATHGWPELAMASALHHQNNSVGDYIGGLPVQLLYLGLLAFPLGIAGFVRLWHSPELRFLAITSTLVLVYVLTWIPGKPYYFDGLAPAILGAGCAAAEAWIARARRAGLRRGLAVAAPLAGAALALPLALPLVPVTAVHKLPASAQQSAGLGNTVGWPQLTAAVAGQDAALERAGQAPTSIFTGYYGEAGALQVLGTGDHLPPVLSGHNAYWMWGPGTASDHIVLAVDALGMLRPYFASCRLLTTWNPPYDVQNDWTALQIGVCTGPSASWRSLWPHLKHYQ